LEWIEGQELVGEPIYKALRVRSYMLQYFKLKETSRLVVVVRTFFVSVYMIDLFACVIYFNIQSQVQINPTNFERK
jgi:hypothetical protein